MARGNAEFSLMKELDVKISRPSSCPLNVNLNLDESMNVEKAFSNLNFQTSMSAREKTRKLGDKPNFPNKPYQGIPALQGDTGIQRVMTPPEDPSGMKRKESKLEWAATHIGIPAAVGVLTGEATNRLQDRRAIKRELSKDQKPRRGFLKEKLVSQE